MLSRLSSVFVWLPGVDWRESMAPSGPRAASTYRAVASSLSTGFKARTTTPFPLDSGSVDNTDVITTFIEPLYETLIHRSSP
jgi:hypothetical protein